MRVIVAAALAVGLVATAGTAKQDDKKVEKLLKQIEDAAKDKKYDEMIKLAQEAEKLDDKNPAIPFALGSAYTAQRKNAEAVEAFTKVIKLAPDVAVAYDRRGDANLKAGKFDDAVKDFDEYLKKVKDGQRKEADANHWRRGIALYYAAKYKDGAEQFERHKSVNPEDVENAAWHYLCSVKAGTEKKKAQMELIPVKDDTRAPMKKIHEMFAGKCQPAEVVAEVAKLKLDGEVKKEAEFYAYLYVALYYEVENKPDDCKRNLDEAVKRKISHYMWDVADVHLKTLKK